MFFHSSTVGPKGLTASRQTDVNVRYWHKADIAVSDGDLEASQPGASNSGS